MATSNEHMEELRAHYSLDNLLSTGKKIGHGAYGYVEEVEVNGVVCAAKKVHRVLLHHSNDGVEEFKQKFFKECVIMSKLRHPHIVQFLGVYFPPEDQRQSEAEAMEASIGAQQGLLLPWLVMELLPMNLASFLEKDYTEISYSVKASILLDISRGLYYLHSATPAIIHRDLTAKNILLTSALEAKIADFGVARITDPMCSTMSIGPGTIAYMPPEVHSRGSGAQYYTSVDIFSFGVIILYTLIHECPLNLRSATYTDVRGQLGARSEVDRRDKFFAKAESLFQDHSLPEYELVALSRNCLDNVASSRPSIQDLFRRLRVLKEEVVDPLLLKDKFELMRLVERGMVEQGIVDAIDRRELATLRHRVEQLQTELEESRLRETQPVEKFQNQEVDITGLREEQHNYGGETYSVQDDGVVDITDPAESNSQYPGIVSFKTSIAENITSSGAEIDCLEDMGISISIAKDSVSPEDVPLDLVVSPCFSGPFELPEGYESASTAYLIDIPQLDKLRKDVTIRIQHHVHLQTEDDCADMVFLTASATPQLVANRQVYSFSVSMIKSVFKCGDQVGEVSLRDFGLLKIGKRRIGDTSNKYEDFQHHYYSVRLYKNLLNEGPISAVLCVCLYNPLYIKHCNRVIAQEYDGMTEKAQGRSEVVAEIKGNEVLFHIEKENGFDIYFDKTPLIQKRDIHLPEQCDIDIVTHDFTDYPPRLAITMEQADAKCAPPRIKAVGLDRKFSFDIICRGTKFFALDQTKVKNTVEHVTYNRPKLARCQAEFSHLPPGSVLQGTGTAAAGTATKFPTASASEIPILNNKDTTDRHLIIIQWTDETGSLQTLKLLEGMSSKWMEIGGLIGLDGIKLNIYATQYRNDPEHCIRAVVNDWKMMCSKRYPPTYGGLLKLLEDAQLNLLAKKLCQAANASNSYSSLLHDH